MSLGQLLLPSLQQGRRRHSNSRKTRRTSSAPLVFISPSSQVQPATGQSVRDCVCWLPLRYLVLDEADKLLTQQMHSWFPQLLQQMTCCLATGVLCSWLRERSELPLSSAALPPPLTSLTPPVTVTDSLGSASRLLSAQSHVQKLLLSATMTQDPEALALLQLYRFTPSHSHPHTLTTPHLSTGLSCSRWSCLELGERLWLRPCPLHCRKPLSLVRLL